MNEAIILPVNRITLRFQKKQHQIEKAYQSFSFINNLKHIRICHWLAIFLFGIFVFVDFRAAPENANIFMIIRLGIVCPLFCIGIALTYWPSYQRISNHVLGFYVLLTAVSYIVMGFYAPVDFHFIYFFGLLACLIFGYTFLRLPFLIASGLGWFVGIAYGFVQFNFSELSHDVLILFSAYLTGFELLLMAICYMSERANRSIFYYSHLMEIEKDKISKCNAELTNALVKVKKLEGMFSICASCKKIKDDNGYWNQIETYIRDHSEADFSHSICPDCVKRLYSKYKIKRD